MEPKLLPLIESIGARYQSLTVDSRLVNALAEPGVQQGEAFIYRRPAFAFSAALGAGTARGLFYWSGHYYSIINGTVFRDSIALGGAVANSGYYSFTSCLGANPVLFLQNGTNGYTITPLGVVAPVADPDYPATTVGGTVYLDGTVYVMDTMSNINGSVAAGNDPTNWDPLNLIKAQIEPTPSVGLAKQLVYIIALKQEYTEAFYDAGNATGSPLAPVQGAKMNYGCVDFRTVRNVGGDLMWVANSGEGYPCAVLVSSLKLEVVSTPPIERILASASSTYYSWNVRIEGHRLYGVTSVGGNFTLVYDLTTKLWYQWTDANGNYLPYAFSCQTPGSDVLFLHATSGNLVTLDVASYKDYSESAFPCSIYTPNYDGGTRMYKALSAMFVSGDQTSTSLTMSYSDDDYATWQGSYSIDMSLDRPMVSDLGSFTKRAFRFIHQEDAPFRLKMVELFLTPGSAP